MRHSTRVMKRTLWLSLDMSRRAPVMQASLRIEGFLGWSIVLVHRSGQWAELEALVFRRLGGGLCSFSHSPASFPRLAFRLRTGNPALPGFITAS